jgi:hypothetical protein
MSRLSLRAKVVRHSSASSERRRTLFWFGPKFALRPADAGATAGTPARVNKAGCRVCPFGRRLSAIVRRRPNAGGPYFGLGPNLLFARLTQELRLARQPRVNKAGCRVCPFGRRLSAIVRRGPNAGGRAPTSEACLPFKEYGAAEMPVLSLT